MSDIADKEPLDKNKSYDWRSRWPSLRAAGGETLSLYLPVLYLALATLSVGSAVITPHLDGSWAYAINRLPDMNVTFGHDVVFSYGPLGYLEMPLMISAWPFKAMAIRIFLHLLFIISLLLYAKAARSPLNLWIFTPCFLVAYDIGYEYVMLDYLQIVTVLLLIATAIINTKPGRRLGWITLPIAGALTAVVLFTKLNTGIMGALALGIGGLVVIRRSFEMWRAVTTSWAIFLLTVALLAAFLLGSVRYLPQWLRGGYDVIQGFSSAMSVSGPRSYLLLAFMAIIIYFSVVGLAIWRNSADGWVGLILAPVVFVAFKAGFARQDGHVIMFFVFLPTALCLLMLCAEHRRALLIYLVGFILVWMIGHPARKEYRPDWFARVQNVITLQAGISQLNNVFDRENLRARLDSQGKLHLQASRLPADWIAMIGNQPCDFLPSEISYAPANNLNWSPMPTLQLYQGYTTYLDLLNARHYIGVRVPDFLIIDFLTIDGMHLLWQGPATWRAILANYELAGVDLQSTESETRLLLKRRPQLQQPGLRVIERAVIRPDEWLNVPRSATTRLYAQIPMWLTWQGQLRKLLLRLPPIMVEVIYESGRQTSFRVAPDLASNGLLLSSLPVNALELADLFSCRPGDRVQRLRVTGPGARFLASPLQVSWNTDALECIPGSTDLKQILARMKLGESKTDLKQLATRTDETDLSVDMVNGQLLAKQPITINQGAGFTTISGWAVDRAARQSAAAVFVSIDDRLEVPATYGLNRPDVAAHLSCPNCVNSGFRAFYPIESMNSGDHELKLKIVTADGKQCYRSAVSINFVVR
jgi:hypothetical protein